MMFIVRSPEPRARPPQVRVVLVRRTPPIAPGGAGAPAPTPGSARVPAGLTDLFCAGDDAAAERLRAQGWVVVPVHDGWYADDAQGGVAVWGQGRYWEVRDTPFSVRLSDVDD
jgi:hypothetical protein